MTVRRIIEWICRIFIGAIFIYASLHKITGPCEFAATIHNYKIAPDFSVNLAAIVLPFIEMVFGVCLIIGILPRGASLGIVLILMFFIAALSVNLVRGIEFECGCFASKGDWCVIVTSWIEKSHPDLSAVMKVRIRALCDIVRDIIFMIPAVTAFILLRKRLGNK
jgi:hypothetical protein